jgi:hypothetical protein
MKIFELEQQIMNCWDVVNDLELLEGPEAAALKVIYKLKFDKMWENFEELCAEYHALRAKASQNCP